MKKWCGSFFVLLGLVAVGSCGDEPVDSGIPDWVNVSGDQGVVKPPSGPNYPGENCQFDPAMEGNQVGQHVKNFTLKDAYNKTYKLHGSCGKDKEVIWVVLAAGW